MQKIKKILMGLAMVGWMPQAFARVNNLGDLSRGLMEPMAGLADLLHAIALVIGIGFLLSGLLQYHAYRQNAQQVRLSTPLLLFALGAVLVTIPMVQLWSESGKLLH